MQLETVLASLRLMSLEQRADIAAKLRPLLGSWHFVPNPGPQTQAFYCQADELFFGGGAGGGKTSLICGLAIQDHEHSLILRRTYPQLSGIFDECSRIMGSREGLREQKKIWLLPQNKRIDFGSVQHEKDREDYQGRPHDLICFDEITQFSETMYNYIIRWNRTASPTQRCRVVATGNPPLTSQGRWVIKYWAPWLDPAHPRPAKPGELRWFTYDINGEEIECEGPDHIPPGCQDKPRSRSFIPAKLEDNPDYLLTGYGSVLAAMPEPMRSMLREGRFDLEAEDEDNQLIPTAWIYQAQQRWQGNAGRAYPLDAIGVDVAQGGKDNTVFAPRRGHYYNELIVYKGIETPNGPAVVERLLPHIAHGAPIIVDLGGGYGGDTLTQLEHAGLEGRGFNGANAAPPNARTQEGLRSFYNMRAYAYWCFREALNPEFGSEIALPPDPDLAAQLAAPKFQITPRGIKMESKIDIKARLGISPDRADAVVMAYMSATLAAKKPKLKGQKQARPTQHSY